MHVKGLMNTCALYVVYWSDVKEHLIRVKVVGRVHTCQTVNECLHIVRGVLK